ncbi:helix-turn-helix domain-containing protein [Actinoplanes couchii]|nr:helix-turn-helix transcriptional regulator [Actinoplanes couchii]MDR6316932.1 transcriptional regulator with XRE-family HTH domain [Actinoplanes couchii]
MTAAPFAALLHAHRRAARMTQRELAVKSGVSVRAISDMERGFSSAPQSRTLDALAGALGLDTARRAALAAAARSSRDRGAGALALPRDLPDFTGRQDVLELLTAGFRPGTVTLVHGPPGVGKTAVVVHAAGRFAGRACFADCRGLTAADVAARVGRAGAPCELLVLDDVESVAQVEPLLPGAGCPVVITSRRALEGLGGLRRVPVGPLPPPDAARMLAAVTGVPEADPDLRRVAGYCEFLPLALRAAGNRLVTRPGWTIGDLAVRLADEDRRLAHLTAGDLSVQRVLAGAYAAASPAERQALVAGSWLFRRIAGDGPGGPAAA